MMKQSQSRKRHHNAQPIAGRYHFLVADGAAWLGYIAYPALGCAFDIVCEGEEGVAAQGYPAHLGQKLLLLLLGQRRGALAEEVLPHPILQHLSGLAGDVAVYGVVAGRARRIRLKGQGQHLRMLAQPPVIGLIPGQAGAMYTRLLPRPHPNGLPV